MCDGRDDCGDSSDECSSMCTQKFQCSTGEQPCLALNRFCDGESQCADGSDEVEVNITEKDTGKFYCHNYWTDQISLSEYRRYGTTVFNGLPTNNRQCYLPDDLVCDGINHCGDHSDECNAACGTDSYFICDNGKCIAARHKCNYIDDCGDGSDECLPDCTSSFKCPDGTCIAASKFCDGKRDCQDGSDERRPLTNGSSTGQLACKSALNFASEECLVPSSYVCDGYEQCLQREDECGAGCEEYSFICGNGKCIISVNKCNGIDDCGDMTDECDAGCSNTFKCPDGSCISLDKFCDGHMDCADGSDEVFIHSSIDAIFETTSRGLYCANLLLPLSERLCLLPDKYVCDGFSHCYERADECQVGCTLSFVCDNGKTCIERMDVCDGRSQCEDGQDEPKAATSLKNLRGFKCYTSRFGQSKPCVLPQAMVNDTVADCDQGIDVCSVPDGKGSTSQGCWHCVSNPDVIISRKQVCDGEYDCPDLSDECLCQDVNATAICQNTCFGTHWSKDDCICKPGHVPCILPDTEIIYPVFCISIDKFCDGVYHCPNHADEISCGRSDVCASSSIESSTPTMPSFIMAQNKTNHCKLDFECFTSMPDNIWTPQNAVACDGKPECFGLEDECGPQCSDVPDFCNFRNFRGWYVCPEDGIYPGKTICDGLKNCSKTGQDEINCPGRFYCSSGEIISIEEHRKCDFEMDCQDGSDEANCTNHFYCEQGKPYFVKIREKYDGKNDCEDGSDECPENSFEKSIFSSKENLIENPFLKGMVWVMGLLSITGNSFVMYNTVRSLSQQTKKLNNVAVIYNFLVFNLAVADLMMGFFLILLGLKDSMLSGKYCREDKGWRSGNMCKVLGVMATVSSETSIVILGILSSYRLLCVIRPVQGRSMHVKSAAILTAITWIVTATVAIIPICPPFADYFVTSAWLAPNPFFIEDVVNRTDMEIFTRIARGYMSNKTEYTESLSWQSMSETLLQLDPSYKTMGYFGYFSTHAVCLPKIFVNHNDTSWEYSVMLTVFNFTMFVYIVLAYIRVSRPNQIQKKRKNSTGSATTRSMQRRIAMLVATDFACWVPTCMIGFVQLGGVPVGPTVYALAAIVLLPINSALNPILYSDSTQNVCAKIRAVYSSLKCKIRRLYRETDHHTNLENRRKLSTTENLTNVTYSKHTHKSGDFEMEAML